MGENYQIKKKCVRLEKKTYKYLRILEADTIKNTLGEGEKYSKAKYTAEISSKG